ncbi:universal stress protein [Haloglomus litoreum]|uniref:universal stress protein n=1 Tax=Haloglomus litoreum TaxID=3034026 RepID=UPI0023E75AD2|nr:universal stress protein [Haloglomus sp. DT116]
MYDPILVPVDGSDAAARAVEEAFDIARESGATVHLLFVLDESATALLFSSESMGRRFERLRTEAEAFLAELADDAAGVPVETAVTRGMGVYRGIIDYAEDVGIELIVMGSTGRHGPAGVLGSTTGRVAANTDIPVMVLSEPKAAESADDGADAP